MATPPENRDATNTVPVYLTPKQWERLAEAFSTHIQGYGTEDQFIAAQLYKGAGMSPNRVAEEFAQGLVPGESVNADGTPK